MTMKVAPDVHTTSHNHIFGVAKSVLVEVVSLLGSAEGCCRLGFNGAAAKPPSRRWAGPWDDCPPFLRPARGLVSWLALAGERFDPR